jgi:flagellar hook-length control protein FliK
VQIELFIPQNSHKLGLLAGSPILSKEGEQIGEPQLCFALPGNENPRFDELKKGEGQRFLSILMGIANDQELTQSESIDLSKLGETENTNREADANKFGIGLQKGETNSSEKINLADLLRSLGVGSSKLEGKSQIINQVIEQSIEKPTVIPEKGYGLDFEKLEAGIEKGKTNPSEKINLADLLKSLGIGSSKLEGKSQIINQVIGQSIEKATVIPEKGNGLDFEKLEVGTEKGETNSSEKINLADLLKSLGANFPKADENDQTSGQTCEKKSIDPEGKALIAGKILLNSNTQEGETTKNLAKDKPVEGITPKLKLDPQNTKGINTESRSFDRDFVSNLSDKTGSDKGQDALLLSNNQSSGKVGSLIAQTEQMEPLQKQFQTEVLTQIVKRAVLNLKNGHTEIKIELKPEFLGHVRMHIATENQQLTVRMLTEIPLVKEIIENNIYQLKSDLQNQGLEVDKFEVFVARDSDQYAEGQENTEFQGTRGQSDNNEEVDGMLAEEDEEINNLTGKYRQGALIGVFA